MVIIVIIVKKYVDHSHIASVAAASADCDVHNSNSHSHSNLAERAGQRHRQQQGQRLPNVDDTIWYSTSVGHELDCRTSFGFVGGQYRGK